MGRPISTDGRAAVELRCDHGFSELRATVLPALRARVIKSAIAYNPRHWHYDENAGVAASDLNDWVAAGEVEVIDQSANHRPADTPDELFDQIADSLREIEAQLPAAAVQVWGFAPPGVSKGNHGGFHDGRTPEGWRTYAGRLMLERHAVGFGHLPGTSRRFLDGRIRNGLGHVTIDNQTMHALKAAADAVIAAKRGLQLMVHPSRLDAPGKLTTEQFFDFLDYIVARREAHEIVTLSLYQLFVASL